VTQEEEQEGVRDDQLYILNR